MNFRIFEIIETEKFQYVRIHKNGNTSIMKCIQDNFKPEEIGRQVLRIKRTNKSPNITYGDVHDKTGKRISFKSE